MSTIDTRMLAGTPIPATPIVERAIELARQKCEPYLFNHVMRSWLFAVRIGQLKGIAHDPEVVALATLLTMLRSTKASLGRAALKWKAQILRGASQEKWVSTSAWRY